MDLSADIWDPSSTLGSSHLNCEALLTLCGTGFDCGRTLMFEGFVLKFGGKAPSI